MNGVKKVLSVFLACVIMFGHLCVFAKGKSYITSSANAIQGDYTESPYLADILKEVFAGDIDIYTNSNCTTEKQLPLGCNMNNSQQYWFKSKTTGSIASGWQCFAYANAVYNKIYHEWVGNGASFSHSEKVISGGSSSVSYTMFKNAGVMCGAYMRTTTNSSGSFNSSGGHSMIILSYDATYITYLEGNGDGNGLVRLATLTWSEFNAGHLSGRSRYICHVVQPTSKYYDDIYGGSSIHITFDANGGTGNAPSVIYAKYHETFSLPSNPFVLADNIFVGWNIKRNSDSKWHVSGKGWLSEADIQANGYEKHLYLPGASCVFDRSWYYGNNEHITASEGFTVYAVWKYEAHKHNYCLSESHLPSCIDEGFSIYTCAACGDSYKTDIVLPLGHEMGCWNQIEPPTATEHGSMQRNCLRCSYVETEIINGKTDGPNTVLVYNDHIYEVYNISYDWDYAKEYCENHGGHLLTINDFAEQRFIEENILSDADLFYYIGGTDRVEEGCWQWVTGEPFDYTNWRPGEPSNAGESGVENFLCLYSNNDLSGQWNDNSGLMNENIGFINEIEPKNFIAEKSIIYNGSEYKLFDCNLSWIAAKLACEILGGQLVSITDKNEQDIILSLLENGNYTQYWIGATDIETEGIFEWITGEEFTFENWNSGEPNNSNDVENYASILKDHDMGKWNDLPYYWQHCTVDTVGFILESAYVHIHTPADPVRENEVVATCTAEGSYDEVVYCSVCGEEISRTAKTIDKLPHDEVTVCAKKATCKEDGYTGDVVCSVCGETISTGKKIDKLLHTPVSVDNGKVATCTGDGKESDTICSVCNETLTTGKTIPATGHTEVTDAAVAPTCTEIGLTEGSHCSVCGEVLVAQEKIPAPGHAEVTDAAVVPTCTETGLTEGSHCSVCGEVLTAQEVVPATGFIDDDGDGYCDKCHTDLGTHEPDDPTANCSCNCHKSGFAKFFWKIINFFHKLFKMEKYHYCDCGNPHW